MESSGVHVDYVGDGKVLGPKRTFKITLYKLMAMHAASYVCELRPALNVPSGSRAQAVL